MITPIPFTIWYATSRSSFVIQEVEITRSSTASVWQRVPALFTNQSDMEKKVARHSSHEDFWETVEEAADHLAEKAKKEAQKAREKLEEAEDFLARYEARKVRLRNVMPTVQHPPGFQFVV